MLSFRGLPGERDGHLQGTVAFPKHGWCWAVCLMVLNGKAVKKSQGMNALVRSPGDPNSSVGPRTVMRPPCTKTLNSFGRECQRERCFPPKCWRFWWCHGHRYSAEQNHHFFCASLYVSDPHWVLARALIWGWAHAHFLHNIQHEQIHIRDQILQKYNSLICCRVVVTRVLFQAFKYDAAHNVKNVEDYFTNLFSTSKNILPHFTLPFETNGQRQ